MNCDNTKCKCRSSHSKNYSQKRDNDRRNLTYVILHSLTTTKRDSLYLCIVVNELLDEIIYLNFGYEEGVLLGRSALSFFLRKMF